MHPLLTGLAVLGLSPFVAAAAGVALGGAVIYGAGHVLVGVGDLLTGGVLRETAQEQGDSERDGRGQGEE